MSISYLNISKEELEKLYKEFGTQQKIADYLKVPVYKVKRLIGKYQLYLNKASLTKNKKAKESFIEKAKKKHGDLYNYNKVLYINSDIPVEIFCKKCQKYFLQSPNNHLTGMGCPYCQNIRISEKQYKSLEKFIEEAVNIHGNRYDYSKVNYLGSRKPCLIICNNCKHEFLQTPMKHICSRHGCPYCNQSKGELRIQNWLDKHLIVYKAQFRFKECKDKRSLPFDFYLPTYNICIEFQGKQHYDQNYYKWRNNSFKNFKTQQKHDQMKRDFCKNKGIKLLEIKYNEEVENKLENFFSFLK